MHVEIAENLREVLRKINRLATDRNACVKLVAVTKKVFFEQILAAIRVGQLDFGESYVQEATKKIPYVLANAPQARFHLIGNLQRNKVKQVVGLFPLIHSVDRYELASEISKIARERAIVQEILIQVNTSQEDSKSGIPPQDLLGLAKKISLLPNVSLKGLMTIGKYYSPESDQSLRVADFKLLRELRDMTQKEIGIHLPELSMGMSHDYELAIKEGATIVRVGSAIFGER